VKTTVDVDRRAADEAAEILGTATLKETINAALLEVVRAARRRELAEQVRNGTLPVPSLEQLVEWRAPRVPGGTLDPPPDR
jgi:Arc/MetJ family transcription regulator